MRKVVTILIVIMLVAVVTIGLWIYYRNIDEQEPDTWERFSVEPGTYELENGTIMQLQLTPYFNGDNGLRPSGGTAYELGFRDYPMYGTASYCDRFYTAEGNGDAFTPYGLSAYSPLDCRIHWTFKTGSCITTKIHSENFGSDVNASAADLRIFIGCENGQLYVLKDDFSNPAWGPSPPVGDHVWSAILDGEVVGVDIFDYRDYSVNVFSDNDLLIASTKNGTLYAFRGSTPGLNPLTSQYNITHPTLFWANHIANISLTSPTISADGDSVFVGTSDGLLYGIDVATGVIIPEWIEPYRVSDVFLNTSPVAIGSLVYISTSDGMVHCIWGNNGTCKQGWTHLGYSNEMVNGKKMERNRVEDGGNLTDVCLTPDGNHLIVGSDSGLIYSIHTASCNFTMIFDTRIGVQDTVVEVAPMFDWRFSKFLFVAARHLNNTNSNPSDDFSILHCLVSPANSTVLWTIVQDGLIPSSPMVVASGHLGSEDIVFSTIAYASDGSEIEGRLYSYSANGRYFAISNESPGFDLLILAVATVTAVIVFNSRERERIQEDK